MNNVFAVPLWVCLASCSVSIGTNRAPVAAVPSKETCPQYAIDVGCAEPGHAAAKRTAEAREEQFNYAMPAPTSGPTPPRTPVQLERVEQSSGSIENQHQAEAKQTAEQQAEADTEFSKREAAAEAQAKLLARHHADPLNVGAFDWSRAQYARADGCEYWQADRLDVSIDEKGEVSWSAFANSDARCAVGTVVPSNCGQSGVGFVEQVDGKLRLVTTSRSRFGGVGAPPVVALWKCGSLRVRAPLSWEPVTSGQCLRLGSEADPVVENISALVCQYTNLFPELNDPGVEIKLAGNRLMFTHDKRTLTLKRRATPAVAHP